MFRASGRATLYSYVIHHRPMPGFTPPYAIAVVALEEGPRMMTNLVDVAQTPEALVLDMPLEVAFQKQDDAISLPVFKPAGTADVTRGKVAIVGAAETTELGEIPDKSQLQLHADAARNALADCGLA